MFFLVLFFFFFFFNDTATTEIYTLSLHDALPILGEFGAVSVVSGHIRGQTNTMPLHAEILYNEYQSVAAFSVASLLALLALVTLVIKSVAQWRHDREMKAANEAPPERPQPLAPSL